MSEVVKCPNKRTDVTAKELAIKTFLQSECLARGFDGTQGKIVNSNLSILFSNYWVTLSHVKLGTYIINYISVANIKKEDIKVLFSSDTMKNVHMYCTYYTLYSFIKISARTV